jgi:predicted DNA-binding protein
MFATQPLTSLPVAKNKQIGVRFSDEMIERIKRLADRNKRTVSDFVRIKMEEVVEAEEERLRKEDGGARG